MSGYKDYGNPSGSSKSEDFWMDTINRIFTELKSKNDDARIRAATALNEYVRVQVREMSGENFGRFMADLSTRISTYVNSNTKEEKAGAVLAIDELIDVDYDEHENIPKIGKFGHYLRMAFSSSDFSILYNAAKALGHLVRTGDALSEFSETVDGELKRALEWLRQPERYEPRRYASVLILKELALNAPTLFNVHVANFVTDIWVALTDQNLVIREAAVEALRACLDVIADREQSLRSQWYSKLWTEARKGLKQKETSPQVHASLLVVGELLVNTGDFMEQYFKEACDTFVKFSKETKQPLVRKTVITIFPRFAALSPDLFTKDYQNTAVPYILGLLKKETEKGRCYLSLGEIAVAVSGRIKPFLESIVSAIKAGFTIKKKSDFCLEALTCTAMLGRAVGPAMRSYMEELLGEMFNGGLSPVLTSSLRNLGDHIPAIMPDIQELLLNFLSFMLGHKPFSEPETTTSRMRRTMSVTVAPVDIKHDKAVDTETIALALQTLGSFDFTTNTNVKNFDAFIEELVRDCVIKLLDKDDPIIRKEAAHTSATLVAASKRRSPAVVAEILEKLLIVGITDRDSTIRQAVFNNLDTAFDDTLAQPENLRSLFLALNDETFEVRELAITVIGRLTSKNPAYVMPSLRKTLLQLLSDLQFSGDRSKKEESARLLSHLLSASHRLIKPYVETIASVLLPNLKEDSMHVSSCVLAALGELSIAGGENMKKYQGVLLPLIIDTLQDQSSATKREVALRALGKISSYTGYVISPFLDYPQLLGILLDEIKGENNKSIRQELIKVLGIVGALDPYRYKMTTLKLKGQSDQEESTGKVETHLEKPASTLIPLSSQEGYYPTAAITALVRILRDPSLSTHYRIVISSLLPILKNLGVKSAKFLPIIMPPFIQILRTSEAAFKEWLFQELSVLVSIVKQQIRDYLDEVFQLIKENWSTPLFTQIITLVEDISVELGDEFKVYLQDLIPPMLKVLHLDSSEKRKNTRKVLHALEQFGSTLEDYLHLVVPAIVNLFQQNDPEMEIPKLALATLGRLCKHLNFSDYASRIVHPIVRLLDIPSPDVKNKDQHSTIMDLKRETLATLCALTYQLESDYAIFIPMVNKVLIRHNISDIGYETLVSRLMKNLPLKDEEGAEYAVLERKGSDFRIRSNSFAQIESESPKGPLIAQMPSKLKTNAQQLQKHWEAESRSTKDDWSEWIRRFSVGLLRESPSPALRSCLSLAQDYFPLVKELFNAGFISIWSELDETFQADLVSNLELALSSPNMPPEILQTLLNLAEFMEHEEKRLPISIKKLGTLAEKSSAYAKALYYKEEEYEEAPEKTIEALISLNNQLSQPKAAEGILKHAEEHHGVKLQETWYEKLYKWEDALHYYRKRQSQDPGDTDSIVGQVRCLNALAKWEELEKTTEETWQQTADDTLKMELSAYGAAASWNTKNWASLEKFVGNMQHGSAERRFYQAILAVQQDQFKKASKYIHQTRRMLDTELTALIGESYNRAYPVVLRAQQLAELEEVVEYKLADDYPERREMIKKIWKERLLGCQRTVGSWQKVLQARSLVLSPLEDRETWLKFASLSRKSNRLDLAEKTLTNLLGSIPAADVPFPSTHPRVSFAYIKHLWATGQQKQSLERLKLFQSSIVDDNVLAARVHQKLGEWQFSLQPTLDEKLIPRIISSFEAATSCDQHWYKGWHSWGLANFEVISHFERTGGNANIKKIVPYLTPAIHGFFRSISLSPSQSLQDTLRLLTLWFKYGNHKEVEEALSEAFATLKIETWLQVIPQIIARISAPVASVRQMIHDLLVNVGKEHPQALVFPLNVALKSQASQRVNAAKNLMEEVRKNAPRLVEQALLVSEELVRVAILWNEMWFEGLEDASRFHFAEHNPKEGIARLQPLHELLDKGPETLAEASFQQQHGRDLREALEWTKAYERSGSTADISQAWDLYYNVFKHTKQAVSNLTKIELEYTSPKLLEACDLELAIPGTYKPHTPIIRISSFAPSLEVISSKQHPRKLSIRGSDGFDYNFLLKGHEDLRQDERVMQLFGLVNTLLASEFETARNNLSIQRYSVIPLAPNSGLLGWVPNCDTLHGLIRTYRDARKIPVTHEHRMLLQMSADYGNLTPIQKIEIFKYCLDNTDGLDLKKILWLQSQTAEVWLERRTNYTRSLAVMSMVGYILGLGDRHCSNLMIDRQTGKVVHIDFGDCFEVAMHREKFPEKIPFRLTRMLVNAMGVSGAEGNFRSTCESVIRVLRQSKESLMAVLEAFVYDPLISWRLLTPNQAKEDQKTPSVRSKGTLAMGDEPDTPNALTKERMKEEAESEITEVLNDKALSITARINNKLTGKDFSPKGSLNVEQQVERLIKQATSIDNLSQCYLGWSPYW